MIIAAAIFAGALVCIIALVCYGLWQQNDISRQLDSMQKELAYIGRVVSAYDKRDGSKQHIKVRIPPAEVSKPKSTPGPDLTIFGETGI
jgi:hypothetical protein